MKDVSNPDAMSQTCPRADDAVRRLGSATPPLHEAHHLTDGGSTAIIALGASLYTLRITRSGKLILTK